MSNDGISLNYTQLYTIHDCLRKITAAYGPMMADVFDQVLVKIVKYLGKF